MTDSPHIASDARPLTRIEAPCSTLAQLQASFPFPTLRPVQAGALAQIADSYDQRTRFTLIEAPTGAGKTGICMAPAIWSAGGEADGNGAHYLTSQNSLVRQLITDFGSHGLVQISGKQNYRCPHHNLDCKAAALLNPGGATCESCPYRVDKELYSRSHLGATTYAYYLTEARYSGKLQPREWLICDEAHNIEREILGLTNVTITQHRCDDVGAGQLPVFAPKEDHRVRPWIAGIFMPELDRTLKALDAEVDSFPGSVAPIQSAMQARLLAMRELRSNLEEYLETSEPGDWLAWTDDKHGDLRIQPLSAARYAQRRLFHGSPNILMTSATVLDADTFRRNLGIPSSKLQSFAVPSEFPVANRRIICWPAGFMGSKNMSDTLPLLAERTARLIKKHAANKKAIIHTHSYRINQYLLDALGKGEHAHRLISHTSMPGKREQAIRDHIETEMPSILMSPSMTEGLDLKDDLARLQIITKVPYPVLDPYNRARMERDPKWYQLQTAQRLVQATGRAVRSADDHALTVILDADFLPFLARNQDILPQWWLDSIEVYDKGPSTAR